MGSDATTKYRSPRAVKSPYKHGHSHGIISIKGIACTFFFCMMGTTLYMASMSGGIMKTVEKEVPAGKAGVQAAVKPLLNTGVRKMSSTTTAEQKLHQLRSPAKKEEKLADEMVQQLREFRKSKEPSPAEQVKQAPNKENVPVMAAHVDGPQHHPDGQHLQLVSSIPKRRAGQYDNRWETAKWIPEWAKDYFAWHRQSTRHRTRTNWKEYKYLVMTCFEGQICGNVAHRLRPIAGMIRLAYDTNRVLLIHWDSPDPLEKYLEPPAKGHGMDWRVPDYMLAEVREAGTKQQQQTNIQQIVNTAADQDRIFVTTRYNDDLFAEPYYNDKLADNEVPVDKVFRDFWNVVFKPTFQLKERITEELEVDNGLKPGQYATVHIEYEQKPQTEDEKKKLRDKVENAMNCMSHLRPGGPFLVAAQNHEIAQEAVDYGEQHNVTIVAAQIAHDTSELPEDLFNSFVEIYFMANTRCVAYGRNGYGQLGYMLGFNHDCRVKYSGERAEKCEWQDAPTHDRAVHHSHLIKIPTKDEMASLHGDANVKMDPIAPRPKHENKGFHWEGAGGDHLPEWSKDYFEWHMHQRAKMSATNYKNFRFLIMTCLDNQRCGNVAHRLRPIAGMMRLAYDSNRLLMIHWEQPDHLEQYLEPRHHGGLDWSVPDYMLDDVHKTGQQNSMKLLIQQAANKDKLIVNAKYNDDEFAEPYYNQHVDESKGEHMADFAFHDIWNVFFKPTFMLLERITESMRTAGLKEGRYAAVHIEYEIEPKTDEEKKDLREKVQNAMNCVSQLRPGGPYLVAAQTYAIAKEAIAYGKEKGVKVAARQIAHDTDELPEDLAMSFVEIYFMANTRCVAYGRNGYGQLGYMLGFEHDCSIQYHGPHGQKCEWKEGKAAQEINFL